MDKEANEIITVKASVQEKLNNVWEFWTNPKHITRWNQASEDWCTSYAENNLTVGGKFLYKMEAKDKSDGFDFSGTYTDIITFKRIAYTLDDGRKVNIAFRSNDDHTEIVESFEAEKSTSVKQQQQGWQSILDHFKEYTEMISR